MQWTCNGAPAMRIRLLLPLFLFVGSLNGAQEPKHLPVGLFIGSIEEGARIFTPVRLRLAATLQRYPRPPIDEWIYQGFAPPPAARLASGRVIVQSEPPPLPGLRVAAFLGDTPLAFIVDTRGLSLEERGMQRATSMGLDITRAEFLSLLQRARQGAGEGGPVIVVYRGGGGRRP